MSVFEEKQIKGLMALRELERIYDAVLDGEKIISKENKMSNGDQCEAKEVTVPSGSSKITRIFDLLGGVRNNATRIKDLSKSINVALLGPETECCLPENDELDVVGILEMMQISLCEIQVILAASIGRLEGANKELKL